MASTSLTPAAATRARPSFANTPFEHYFPYVHLWTNDRLADDIQYVRCFLEEGKWETPESRKKILEEVLGAPQSNFREAWKRSYYQGLRKYHHYFLESTLRVLYAMCQRIVGIIHDRVHQDSWLKEAFPDSKYNPSAVAPSPIQENLLGKLTKRQRDRYTSIGFATET